jgi:hypothetical protein
MHASQYGALSQVQMDKLPAIACITLPDLTVCLHKADLGTWQCVLSRTGSTGHHTTNQTIAVCIRTIYCHWKQVTSWQVFQTCSASLHWRLY